MSRLPYALFIAALASTACTRPPTPAAAPMTPPVETPSPAAPAEMATAPAAEPDLAALLANASYLGLHDQPIKLDNGQWQGEPFEPDSASRPSARAMTEVAPVRGDLDGDGQDEAIAFVAYDGGGSGVFVHLAAFALKDGHAVNIATTDIGDRVRVEKAAIERGRIIVDVIESGPNDPACCPTTKAQHIWTLVDGALKEDAPAPEDKTS